MIVVIRNTIRIILISIRHVVLKKLYGMDISNEARISFGAKLDKTNPKGIHIGNGSYIASGSLILSHDFCRGIKADTYVGTNSFIGANVIIMPGIKIGDQVIIGSGSVVTRDIASHSIAAGNPAKVIRTGINTSKYGKIEVHH